MGGDDESKHAPRTTVGVIGGTGPAGSALAARLAASGHGVWLGSRDHHKATDKVAELADRWGDRVASLRGVANRDAATADVVVLATVAESAVGTAADHAAELDGRVVVSMANLLTKQSRGFAAVHPESGSVAVSVQLALPRARVVGAFQNLPARALGDLDNPIDADIVVCGDDADAVGIVMRLTETMTGLHPVDGGPLINAASVEAMTAVLLNVNRARGGEHGVRFVELRHRRS
jgi:NADPH-dependent F420 reductase